MNTYLYSYIILVAVVALQRILELRRSKRNEKKLKEQGGQEIATRHFIAMRWMHTLWLVSCVAEAWWRDNPGTILVAAMGITFLILGQILRLTAIHTLKERWTVTIIVLPQTPPVTGGIYRYFRHPNYLGVVLEILSLPIIYSCWYTAIFFSLANACILWIRIRAEEKALENAGGYYNFF